MSRRTRVWWWLQLAAWALGPWASRAWAQDAVDVGRLAHFVRWGGVLAAIPLVLGMTFVIRVVENVGDRLSRQFPSRRPTIQKIQTTVQFGIYVLALMLTIGLSIKLDSTSLTVIGGSVAFAVGFALRDLVASFVAGITIMFDRPFQVGDRVSYGGQYGDIVKIGLRSVRMNTLDHNVITIPNNKIFTDVTSSSTYGALEMLVPIECYIGVDQDVRLATELLREACLTSPYVFLEHPVPVEVKQVIVQDYVAIQLKARPYVFDCNYEKAFETDVHFRALDAFRQHGIAPPAVLHRTLAEPSSKDAVRRG